MLSSISSIRTLATFDVIEMGASFVLFFVENAADLAVLLSDSLGV